MRKMGKMGTAGAWASVAAPVLTLGRGWSLMSDPGPGLEADRSLDSLITMT